jgi:hypothetical protein
VLTYKSLWETLRLWQGKDTFHVFMLFLIVARYQILHSCLVELMEKHIISPEVILLSDPRELIEESQGIQESVENGVIPQYAISTEDEMNIPMAFQKQAEGLLDETVSYEGRLWKIALSCEVSSSFTSTSS